MAALADRDRLRTLDSHSRVPGTIDLTHNDYLALRDDLDHQSQLRAALRDLPATAGASRLLGGEHPIFAALEQDFSAFKGADASLFFPSGYAANESVITALAALPGTAFFSDALNHASLIDGFRLAALAPDRKAVFRHNDAEDLEAKLKASPHAVNIIVTETVFSMDGDRAPLKALARLAAQYRGILVLDEAHAVFVLGTEGRGLAGDAEISPDAIITVNTCGKALAVQGALVSGPVWLRPWLINKARPFIYTTGPSPWLAAALRATLVRARDLAPRRAHLAAVAARVRSGLRAAGLDAGASSTHIIPVAIGDDGAALAVSARLAAYGFRARAVRPPTVPEGTARLRLSLHAGLSLDDADRLVAAVKACR